MQFFGIKTIETIPQSQLFFFSKCQKFNLKKKKQKQVCSCQNSIYLPAQEEQEKKTRNSQRNRTFWCTHFLFHSRHAIIRLAHLSVVWWFVINKTEKPCFTNANGRMPETLANSSKFLRNKCRATIERIDTINWNTCFPDVKFSLLLFLFPLRYCHGKNIHCYSVIIFPQNLNWLINDTFSFRNILFEDVKVTTTTERRFYVPRILQVKKKKENVKKHRIKPVNQKRSLNYYVKCN